jgi:hypothetical protein
MRVATTLLEADLPGLTLRHRGKVRDVFELGDERLLIEVRQITGRTKREGAGR